MRRWEYLELDVHVEHWSGSDGRSGRLPAVQVGAGRLASVAPLLNELGAEGWELAGVAGSQSPLIFRLFLKRRAMPAHP